MEQLCSQTRCLCALTHNKGPVRFCVVERDFLRRDVSSSSIVIVVFLPLRRALETETLHRVEVGFPVIHSVPR